MPSPRVVRDHWRSWLRSCRFLGSLEPWHGPRFMHVSWAVLRCLWCGLSCSSGSVRRVHLRPAGPPLHVGLCGQGGGLHTCCFVTNHPGHEVDGLIGDIKKKSKEFSELPYQTSDHERKFMHFMRGSPCVFGRSAEEVLHVLHERAHHDQARRVHELLLRERRLRDDR